MCVNASEVNSRQTSYNAFSSGILGSYRYNILLSIREIQDVTKNPRYASGGEL